MKRVELSLLVEGKEEVRIKGLPKDRVDGILRGEDDLPGDNGRSDCERKIQWSPICGPKILYATAIASVCDNIPTAQEILSHIAQKDYPEKNYVIKTEVIR